MAATPDVVFRGRDGPMQGPVSNDADVVSVEHLHKAYGATVAVEDVSFSVRAGEIFGILGRNGAGKTTTVECLSGLRVPDGGRLDVLGLDPRRTAESCTSGSASSSRKAPYHRRSASAKPSSSTPPSIGDPRTAIISLGCSGSTRSGTRITANSPAGRSSGCPSSWPSSASPRSRSWTS